MTTFLRYTRISSTFIRIRADSNHCTYNQISTGPVSLPISSLSADWRAPSACSCSLKSRAALQVASDANQHKPKFVQLALPFQLAAVQRELTAAQHELPAVQHELPTLPFTDEAVERTHEAVERAREPVERTLAAIQLTFMLVE